MTQILQQAERGEAITNRSIVETFNAATSGKVNFKKQLKRYVIKGKVIEPHPLVWGPDYKVDWQTSNGQQYPQFVRKTIPGSPWFKSDA